MSVINNTIVTLKLKTIINKMFIFMGQRHGEYVFVVVT